MAQTPTPRPIGFAATTASAPTAAAVVPPRLPRRGTAKGDAHARRILDGLPVPVLSLLVPHGPEQQTRVAWINRAAEEVMGRSAEDLTREPASLWGHVHADDVAPLREWLAAPTNQPLCSTIRFVTREGRLRRYELVAQPRSEDQVPGMTAVDVVLHDVSTRVDLQQAVEDREQQIKVLAESSRDVVFHLRLHPQLTVAWTNDAAPNLLGISPTELHEDATALFRTVFPEHRDRLREALQTAVGGPTTTTFDINRHGERVTVEMDLRPVRSAGQTALLAVGRRVGQPGPLHVPAAPTAAAAPASARAKTTSVPPAATPAMTPAGIEAEELEAAGLARIDVGALMRQVVRDVSLVGRTVELHLEKAPLQADVVFLRPALEAVIDNVRKHTPEGTNVRIVVARTSAGVLVSVADDGPGHAWPEGHRANAKGIADLADAGLGSGDGFRAMAMAADRHTGRAAMQSAPGAGTTVRLLLHDAQPVVQDAPVGADDFTVVAAPAAPVEAAVPAKLVTLGHAPAFRDEPLEALAPRFIEVDA